MSIFVFFDCDFGYDDVFVIWFVVGNDVIDFCGVIIVGGNGYLEYIICNVWIVFMVVGVIDVFVVVGVDKLFK